MRLLTHAQHSLLECALDSHRERLENLMTQQGVSELHRTEWDEEHEQTRVLRELIIHAGVVTLSDHT